MDKETFMKLILCRYYFAIGNSPANNWKEAKRLGFISGAHTVWNMFRSEKISPLEFYQLRQGMNEESAAQWWEYYTNKEDEDMVAEQTLFELMDFDD